MEKLKNILGKIGKKTNIIIIIIVTIVFIYSTLFYINSIMLFGQLNISVYSRTVGGMIMNPKTKSYRNYFVQIVFNMDNKTNKPVIVQNNFVYMNVDNSTYYPSYVLFNNNVVKDTFTIPRNTKVMVTAYFASIPPSNNDSIEVPSIFNSQEISEHSIDI